MNARIAGATLFLLSALPFAGCFDPPVDPNGECKVAGTCECATRDDCAEGLDCIDGRCQQYVRDSGPAPGELGTPCDASIDCNSGFCLPAGPGRTGVCTVPCDDAAACPGNWECKSATFADAGAPRLCVPPFNALCLGCSTDQDCNATGDLCLDVGGAKVCGRDCSESGCPAGYACEEITAPDGGVRGRQCVPNAGSCTCSDLTVGLGRGCKSATAEGTCFGFEVCQSDGTWAGCDAPAPSSEVCNGADDDCDGLVDADDPGVDTSGLPATPAYPGCQLGTSGACVGLWTCTDQADGGIGWVCGAPAPAQEACNGRDEDCDGTVDEDFLSEDDQYVDDAHCGACGYDCAVAVQNLLGGRADGGVSPGAVRCDVRNGAPTCVPLQCAAGYAPYPVHAPVMCQRAVGSSCRACAVDADCGPFGDRCVEMPQDTGSWCAQSCGASAPYPGCTGVVGEQGCCPGGYTCESMQGQLLCVPQGGSCTCSSTRAAATRSCLLTVPGATCVGVETCGSVQTPAGAEWNWGTCDTATTTVELCDNADNNCDGKVDEPFINTRGSGTWDTDEQCGSCQTNCKAQWNPAIQHAIGGCDAGVNRPPSCEIVRCTEEQVGGGGACQLDADCGPGRNCHPLYRQCVSACTGPQDCGGNACVGGFCSASCTTNSDCTARFGTPSVCTNGTCSVRYQFVNADKEPTNGCECPRADGTVDTPDVYATYPNAGVPYVDRDCDGVDGVEATSLFVRAGSAGGNGTRASPFGSLTQAINAFSSGTHSAILVAAGSYVEQVVLKNGVKLYGGYSSDFTRRDIVDFPTLIEGVQPAFANPNHRRGTVNAENITQSTVLAGFTIRGYDVTFRPPAGVPGKNSYAVYVKNASSALVLANNHIIGGRGGDAAQGQAGQAGSNGSSGADGLDSKECTTTHCSGEAQPGGAGGSNAACPGSNGTSGAAASGNLMQQGYQPPLGKNGQGGANGTYGSSSDPSLCKYDCQIPFGGLNGGAAQNGNDGQAFGGGNGCASPSGSIVFDEWVGGGGGAGATGSPGSGGGGGGAGGGVQNTNSPNCSVGNRVGDLGGTGGGGGAGGCGGSAGLGGASGGGSFALFVVFTQPPASVPAISGNRVAVGAGGNGGSGGPGGYGGAGGQGGEGGVAKLPAWCAGLGGPGGRGGNGGAGSGGGGGCGGAAFGIAGNFIGAGNYGSKNTLTAPPAGAAGNPGAGGASPAGGAAHGTSGSPGGAGTLISF